MALNNDFPADAYLVTIGASGQYISGPNDLSNFTKTSDEPFYTNFFPGKTSWYQYTPATSGTVTLYATGVDPADTSSNLPVEIYGFGATSAGVVDANQALGGNNNLNNPTAATSWSTPVTGGTLYFVRVSPAHNDPTISYLKVVGPATAAPPNDLIAGAVPVAIVTDGTTWISPPVPDDQLTVTSEEPYQSGFQSAWWQLLPVTGGNYTITATAFAGVGISPTNTVMRIYYGNHPPAMTFLSQTAMATPVTLNFDNSFKIWFEIVQTSAGTDRFSYQLRVTGPATQVPVPDTTNHQYTNAIIMPTSGAYTTTTDTTPSHFGDTETNPTPYSLGYYRAAWYTITPATTGAYTFAVTANGTGIEIDLFTGTDFHALASAVSAAPVVGQTLNAGTQYYYRVAANNSSPQTYSVSMASDLDTTNHQYANAITIPAHGTWSATLDTSPSHFGDTESNPTSGGLGYYRAGWYSFTPDTSTVYTFTASPDTYNVEIDLIRQDSATVIAAVTGYPASIGQQLTAGVAYWLRVASSSNAAQHVALSMTSPVTVLPAVPIAVSVRVAGTASQPMVQAPPVAVTVALNAHIAGEFSTADALPIAVDVALPDASDTIDSNAAPPITVAVAVQALAVEAGIFLTQPVDGEVIVTSSPQFIVALQQHDDDTVYTIEIQYDESSDFSSPITLTGDSDSTGGGVVFDATTALTGSTGYWRARLLLEGQELITWTPANTFTIDATVTSQNLPVTWTVSTGAARPIHLWHVDPPGPHVGDLLTAYGQGFPATGNLTVADLPQAFESWQLIAASTAMSGEGRVIDADVVDPEHYEVTFYAPDLGDEPGGALVVEA